MKNVLIKNYFIFFVGVLLPLLFASCKTEQRISNQNLSSLFQRSNLLSSPEYYVSHQRNDSTLIYLRFLKKELSFATGINGEKEANLFIAYKLRQSYETAHLIDTASFTISFKNNEENKNDYLVQTISLKLPGKSSYLLEIKIIDTHSNKPATVFVNINNESPNSRQNFMVWKSSNPEPLYNYTAKSNDTLLIYHKDENVKKITARYYYRNFPLAAPPFSVENPKSFDYVADSLFDLEIGPDKHVILSKHGFYHLQLDTNDKTGLTIFRFDDDFPNLMDAKLLLEPLRYLGTKREFDEMKSNPNPKMALDLFWMKLAGNPERAKQLIRKYYYRVHDANRLFTSYLEGWKTDRGLIYIVFGIPNIVYRTGNSESWVYGEARHIMSVNFTFTKVINPFTDNDFILNRTPIYENTWYNAVDTWRQGRVFNDN